MNTSIHKFTFILDSVQIADDEILSDQTALLVLKILVYGVTPGISAFGVFGNILSIMILKRHGLHKCSNILLVSLAFSDICFLVGFNNVPKTLYDIQGNGRFLYSKAVSYILFIIYFIFTIFDYGMAFLGLTIPALITAERLIAVYLPLSMTRIVTPFRTWAIVLVLGTYSMVCSTYTCFWYRLDYTFDEKYNTTVGRLGKTELFELHKDFRIFMDLFQISVKIQPMFTMLGCVLIIVKVKLASIKRQKMAGGVTSKSSVSKTTKMLMAVCVVYICVCIVVAMPTYLPESVVHYNLSSEGETSNLSLIMYQVLNIVLCLNSSWNFIIYIVFNKNFRDTFNAITSEYFCCRIKKRG